VIPIPVKHVAEKWMKRQSTTLTEGKTLNGKTAPVKSAVTAEIALLGGEIPLSSWNYSLSDYHYQKLHN
jgi:hypothetical protein